ncbi:MAG: hypothetical protein IJK58_09440 [Clostridia bacterium]|nr:hypothetical protein [Clostridia bacterium]
MKIEDFDRNLKVDSSIDEPDIVWLSVRDDPFSLHGIWYEEESGCFVRMPKGAEKISEGVGWMRRCPTGGRVRFRTDSKFIGIRAVMDLEGFPMPHMADAGQAGFDLYVKRDGDERSTLIGAFEPDRKEGNVTAHFRSDFGAEAEYTIHFPLYSEVKDVFIALKKGSSLSAAAPYMISKPVVYYGSSITQGGCAPLPGNSYESIIASRYGVDFVNLGFSGGCLGEVAMAEYIRELDMSALVIDYDHNAPDAEHLRRTHGRFFDLIREKKPDLPVIFMTAPNILPWYTWYQPRRDEIKATYDRAVAAGDKNVYYIEGAELFGDVDADLCTVDSCHPNALGFYRMAMRVWEELKKILP